MSGRYRTTAPGDSRGPDPVRPQAKYIRKAWRNKMKSERERQAQQAEEAARKVRAHLAQNHGPDLFEDEDDDDDEEAERIFQRSEARIARARQGKTEDEPPFVKYDREHEQQKADAIAESKQMLKRVMIDTHEEAMVQVREYLGDMTIRSFTVYRNAIKVDLGTKHGDPAFDFTLHFDHADDILARSAWRLEAELAHQLAPHLYDMSNKNVVAAERIMAALPRDSVKKFADKDDPSGALKDAIMNRLEQIRD